MFTTWATRAPLRQDKNRENSSASERQTENICEPSKEAAYIGHSYFLVVHLGLHLSSKAEKEPRYVQHGPLLLSVSTLCNNTIVAKTYFNYNFKMGLLIYISPSECAFQ
jgi:hypothetical protein